MSVKWWNITFVLCWPKYGTIADLDIVVRQTAGNVVLLL